MALEVKSVTNLKELLEAYGIGVRAGVITPCLQDENAFRKIMGLDPAPPDVVADWTLSDGVRRPITLTRPEDTIEGELAPADPDQPAPAKEEA